MKIVAITDKPNSAIDRLARMNEVRLPHLQYKVFAVHPKRPSEKELNDLLSGVSGADLVDVQYWKSGTMLRKKYPTAFEGKKIVLTHHNEHNINDTEKDHWDWKDMDWDGHVAKNGWQKEQLKKQGIDALLIRHAIDWENFSYAESLTSEKVVGYVGQIKKVKGIKQMAQACKELGYKLALAGSVSEAAYYQELMQEYSETIQWALPGGTLIPDRMLGEFYHKMAAYCANSDDGTESGTMPILEAMASGIPVVTRNFGLVRDCGEHAKNMWIRTGKYDDVEDLKQALKMVVEHKDIANDLRENAWRTVRQYHPDLQAREYDKLFRRVLYPREPSVSVIMATAGRNEQVEKNLLGLANQRHKNFEVVVCDDNDQYDRDVNPLGPVIERVRGAVHFPIRHVITGKREPGYGLAKARNLGIIEATGEILVFCDDRLVMHDGAIQAFVSALLNGWSGKPEKKWVWGSKGTFKNFVENFSASWRRSVIDGGMFNERIDCYGGMTQEISSRFGNQGFRFEFCPQALAEPAFGTHSKSKHRENIVTSKVRLYKMGYQ